MRAVLKLDGVVFGDGDAQVAAVDLFLHTHNGIIPHLRLGLLHQEVVPAHPTSCVEDVSGAWELDQAFLFLPLHPLCLLVVVRKVCLIYA